MDNHYRMKETIMSKSQVQYPVDPDKPYTPVAVLDICRATDAILRNPEPHVDKIYHLASDRYTMQDLSKVRIASIYSLCRLILATSVIGLCSGGSRRPVYQEFYNRREIIPEVYFP